LRILFKTSYLDDIRLFPHSGYLVWYGILGACLLLAPLVLRISTSASSPRCSFWRSPASG
jgi:hypothetical protein